MQYFSSIGTTCNTSSECIRSSERISSAQNAFCPLKTTGNSFSLTALKKYCNTPLCFHFFCAWSCGKSILYIFKLIYGNTDSYNHMTPSSSALLKSDFPENRKKSSVLHWQTGCGFSMFQAARASRSWTWRWTSWAAWAVWSVWHTTPTSQSFFWWGTPALSLRATGSTWWPLWPSSR